jgi:hypothetical protein
MAFAVDVGSVVCALRLVLLWFGVRRGSGGTRLRCRLGLRNCRKSKQDQKRKGENVGVPASHILTPPLGVARPPQSKLNTFRGSMAGDDTSERSGENGLDVLFERIEVLRRISP